MNIPALIGYLTRQLKTLVPESSLYCNLSHGLQSYQETNPLLQVCGYDTDELESAITATKLAIQTLKHVLERAVDKFNRKGVCVALAGQDTPAAQVDKFNCEGGGWL